MAETIKFEKKEIEGDPRNRLLLQLYAKATEAVDKFDDKEELRDELELIRSEIEEVLLSEGLASWEPVEYADVEDVDGYAVDEWDEEELDEWDEED